MYPPRDFVSPYPQLPVSIDRKAGRDPCCLGNVTSRPGPIRGKALGRVTLSPSLPIQGHTPNVTRPLRPLVPIFPLSPDGHELLLASRTDAATRRIHDGQFPPL